MDKLVFWVKNEHEYGAAWRPTGERLSTFLLHVAVFEAVLGAAYGASACRVSAARVADILAPMRPLPMPEWRWPSGGCRLYAADGLLALAGGDGGPGETTATRAVWVAADEPGRLAYLREVDGVEWDAFAG